MKPSSSPHVRVSSKEEQSAGHVGRSPGLRGLAMRLIVGRDLRRGQHRGKECLADFGVFTEDGTRQGVRHDPRFTRQIPLT
jgi:hypothetical protein